MCACVGVCAIRTSDRMMRSGCNVGYTVFVFGFFERSIPLVWCETCCGSRDLHLIMYLELKEKRAFCMFVLI